MSDMIDALVEISEYVTEHRITNINTLIADCAKNGKRGWLAYISSRGWLISALVEEELNRQIRIKYDRAIPGDYDREK